METGRKRGEGGSGLGWSVTNSYPPPPRRTIPVDGRDSEIHGWGGYADGWMMGLPFPPPSFLLHLLQCASVHEEIGDGLGFPGPMPNCSPLCQLPTTPKLILPLLSVSTYVRTSLPLCDCLCTYIGSYVLRIGVRVLRASEVSAIASLAMDGCRSIEPVLACAGARTRRLFIASPARGRILVRIQVEMQTFLLSLSVTTTHHRLL
jgi:hypothetical protein